MSGFFAAFAFFGSSGGLILIGLVAAGVILLWEWRTALVGLLVIQLGVIAATVHLQRIPTEWATVIVGVSVLSGLMLAVSAQRIQYTGSLYQSGTWLQRAMILALFALIWRAAAASLQLPEFAPELVQLFAWLVFCLLTILGLSENPLFTAVALLLWLAPVQAVATVLVGVPAIVALIGLLQIMVALACSYLILVEQIPAEEGPAVLTDITFPTAAGAEPARTPDTPDLDDRIGDWVQRQTGTAWAMVRRHLPALQLPLRRKP